MSLNSFKPGSLNNYKLGIEVLSKKPNATVISGDGTYSEANNSVITYRYDNLYFETDYNSLAGVFSFTDPCPGIENSGNAIMPGDFVNIYIFKSSVVLAENASSITLKRPTLETENEKLIPQKKFGGHLQKVFTGFVERVEGSYTNNKRSVVVSGREVTAWMLSKNVDKAIDLSGKTLERIVDILFKDYKLKGTWAWIDEILGSKINVRVQENAKKEVVKNLKIEPYNTYFDVMSRAAYQLGYEVVSYPLKNEVVIGNQLLEALREYSEVQYSESGQPLRYSLDAPRIGISSIRNWDFNSVRVNENILESTSVFDSTYIYSKYIVVGQSSTNKIGNKKGTNVLGYAESPWAEELTGHYKEKTIAFKEGAGSADTQAILARERDRRRSHIWKFTIAGIYRSTGEVWGINQPVYIFDESSYFGGNTMIYSVVYSSSNNKGTRVTITVGPTFNNNKVL